MTQEDQALGNAIRGIRKARRLTQETLAFESGLDRAFISQIERGVQQPTVATLLKLARALDTPVSNIFAMAEGTPPEESPREKPKGLPSEYLEEAEEKLREIIASGDTDAAVAYIRFKMMESYLLCMKSQYENWKQGKKNT